MNHPLVVGITGASGAAYAVRLLQVLLRNGADVHLTISPSGRTVIAEELGVRISADHFEASQLGLGSAEAPSGANELLRRIVRLGEEEAQRGAAGDRAPGRLVHHHHQDYMASIASGSFLTGGMVICPCSGGTLSAVVHGASTNLVQRAADVHIKEGRKLILVPRETPLSLIQLDNMRRAAEAGAIVLPAMPGWYHGVRSLTDLVDFVVARILDQLGVPHQLMKRWGTDEVPPGEGHD